MPSPGRPAAGTRASMTQWNEDREASVADEFLPMGSEMSKISRRNFVKAGAAATAAVGTFGILTERAKGAEFVYKFANNQPVNHPMNVRLNEMMPKVLEESNGKLEIRVFPNNQLGADTDMLSQLRSGALEIFALSGINVLSTMNKVTSLYGVAFAFPNYDVMWSAVDGDLGAYLRGVISKLNMYAFEKLWDNGFRQITTSTKPITKPDDLKGFKIRVPVSPLWTSTFQALGATPISVNFAEAYSALQTRIADGQENPLTLIYIAKFYEVQKYCSITNHMWDGLFNLMNGRAWAALSPDLQQILARNVNGAVLKARGDLVELNKTVADDLKKNGMIFNETNPDEFRSTLSKAGYYKQWKETFGPEAWNLLEKYSGPLT
jgi:TRAP-type transport system periplasmic protein